MEKCSPQPCLDDLTHSADSGHNPVAYLVAILLYRHNAGAGDDGTARQCMRWVKGEKESSAAVVVGDCGGPMSR